MSQSCCLSLQLMDEELNNGRAPSAALCMTERGSQGGASCAYGLLHCGLVQTIYLLKSQNHGITES